MAQKRVDVLNRSGGLSDTSLPKVTAKQNTPTNTQKKNIPTSKQERELKQSRSNLNRAIQESKSINKQLKHVQTSKVDGVIEIIENQKKEEYEKNKTEENAKAFLDVTKALDLNENRVNKLLEEQRANSQKVKEATESYNTSKRNYASYINNAKKSDKFVSQKPQPKYTLEDLAVQKSDSEARRLEKELPVWRSQLEEDFDWTNSAEREKRKQIEDQVAYAESFLENYHANQEAKETLTKFYGLPEEDRNNIILVAGKRNSENFSFLNNLFPSVDVAWVPGQGVQPVSEDYRANIAYSELYKKGYNAGDINKMADAYLRNANAEASKKIKEGAAELTNESPFLANIARQPLNLVGGLASGIDYGVETLKGLFDASKRNQVMDPNRPGTVLSNISDTIYSTTKENIDSKVGKVAYGAGTALVDNIARFYAGGGTQAGTLSLAGLSTYGSGVREASERGAKASQASLKGLTDAASEVITELLPLDNIIKLKSSDIGNVANVLKEGLKQAGIEVTTEEINYGIGLLSDWLIMGDKSQANLQKRELMEQGWSEKAAEKKVVQGILSEAGNLALETALSSFAQAGIEGGTNLLQSKNSQNTTTQQTTEAQKQQEAEPQPIVREPFSVSPVQSAVENVKAGNPVSNSQAEAILQNADSLSELSQKIGVQFGGTKSEMRQQVKQAVYSLAQNENIDVTNKEVYDDKNNIGGIGYGLQDNDRRTGSGNLAERVAGVQRNNGNDAERGREYGQVALNSGVVRVSDQIQKARTERGIQSYEMFDTTSDPQSYEQALTDGRNSDTENGWCVTPKSAQELVDGNVRTMMNDNKTVGVGVASDGDIVAVFKNKNGGPKRALDTAMPMAIENGGDRLDCYGEGLVRVYSEYGFVPVARVEFNPEYANDGWTPDKGTPYIYFMMHNGDSAADVVQKMHTYPKYTKEQLDALPTFGKEDYDAAMDYRNELIDQRKNEANREGANPALGAADRNFSGLEAYNDLLTDDNIQPERANDVLHEEVPLKDPYGNDVSRNASNVINSDMLSERDVNNVKKMIAEGLYGHQTQKMKDVQDNVEKELVGKSLSAETHNLSKLVTKGRISEHDIAKAQILLAHYTTKKGAQAESLATELLLDLEQMATQSGRQLNMFKLIRSMTPIGQTRTVASRVEKYVESINHSRSEKNQAKVTIPQELLDEHTKAAREASKENATQEAVDRLNEIENQIYLDAASQIGSTLREKWDAWRHMSMLGTGKTQTKNFGGNILFRPFVAAKRVVGAALEKVFNVSKEQRTKSIVGLGKEGRALMELARNDARSGSVRDRMSGNTKTGDNARNAIDENRTIFDYTAAKDTSKAPKAVKQVRQFVTEVFEGARTEIQDMMEETDFLFKRWEYTESMASFIKARGYTSSQWKNGQIPAAVMEEARSYAASEAMKATFNDVNSVSNLISKAKSSIKSKDGTFAKILDIAFEGVFPYVKTPVNVAVRAFEYSPANLAKTIITGVSQVKNGKITASQAIDNLSSGLVGSAAVGLGYALASGIFGIRLVGAEKDEDEERMGHQSYALEIGDKSYTIDWAAPSNIPIFVGANLYKTFSETGNDDVPAFAKFLSATANTFEPMLELSMLSSLNDLVNNLSNAKQGEKLYALAASISTSYLMQGLPTLASQLDQLGDDTRKMTYATSEDPTMRQVEKLLGKVSQKLPGDIYQTEYVDAWGRTEKSNWFESLISPSYSEEINETDADLEIKRLNEVLDDNVSPSTPAYTITIDKNTRRLSGDEWSNLAKVQGQTAYELVDQLIKSDEYQQYSDADKAKAIEDVYNYAREYARVKVLGDYDEYSDKWMKYASGKEIETILGRNDVRASGLGSDKRYETAKELGIEIPEMQKVSSRVDDRLDGIENKTDYDTYRAVLDSVPEEDAAKWLQVYGMSESRLEDLAEANKNGISTDYYVDYLEANSMLDKAFTQITKYVKNGEEPPVELLSEAYEFYNELPKNVKDEYQSKLGGRMEAYANAKDAGIEDDTFVELWSQYYSMSNDSNSAAKDATNWATVLDKAKASGKITQKQYDVMWDGLSFYSQIRQDAKKYFDLTDEGLKPDVARTVYNLLSGIEKTTDKLKAISDANLTEEEKMSAAYAYLDENQDKKFKAITDMGIDTETYAALYGLYSTESGDGKKARVVAKYQKEYGLTNAQAKKIYDIYAGRK